MNHKTDMTRRKVMIGGAAAVATAAALVTIGSAVAAGYDAADLGLFGTINRVKDAANMTGLEKKHAPVIKAPAKATQGETVAVTVTVGTIPHPMTDAHWIEKVRVFTDKGAPVADVSFARTGVAPVITVNVPVEASTTLIAQAFCNLHGIWESRHSISV